MNTFSALHSRKIHYGYLDRIGEFGEAPMGLMTGRSDHENIFIIMMQNVFIMTF